MNKVVICITVILGIIAVNSQMQKSELEKQNLELYYFTIHKIGLTYQDLTDLSSQYQADYSETEEELYKKAFVALEVNLSNLSLTLYKLSKGDDYTFYRKVSNDLVYISNAREEDEYTSLVSYLEENAKKIREIKNTYSFDPKDEKAFKNALKQFATETNSQGGH